MDIDKEQFSNDLIKYLEKNCSIKDKLYTEDKQSYIKLLTINSDLAEIRNSTKPYGEKCIYFGYNKNFALKFVEKNGWNGYLPVLVTWNLCIIDIDNKDILYDDIIEMLEYYYPNDLFYIHKTNAGYHLFLMSRLLDHNSKESIKMKITLLGDVAHGTNTIYTGNSVRLCLKENDKLDIASKFIGKYEGKHIKHDVENKEEGKNKEENKEENKKGILNDECDSIYKSIIHYLEMFKICNVTNIINCDTIMKYIYDNYLEILRNDNDMGAHQINVITSCYLDFMEDSCTYKFCDKFDKLKLSQDIEYEKFLKHRVLNEPKLDNLILNVLKSMSYNNLYRIIDSNDEYAYGCHVQESLYFIVYKNLLVVDYDNPSRLKILSAFCRYHPEYKFRIVRTNAGYHCFLTSHRINHKHSYNLLSRLCSDPMHIISSIVRGYSVRVNQKHRYEKPYKECHSYGKGEEIPELVQLYQIHLDKYKEYSCNNLQLYRVHNIVTKDMLSKFLVKNLDLDMDVDLNQDI